MSSAGLLDFARVNDAAAATTIHPVPPRVVLEIAFDQIQRSARHAGGYALRFDRLSRVAEIYESTHNFGRREAEPEPLPEPTLFDRLK